MRSFNKAQRTEAITAGAAEGVVLKRRADTSLGNVFYLMTEWNLRELADPSSDTLLRLLEFRATKSLHEQYCVGITGVPGDHLFITETTIRQNHVRAFDSFRHCCTLFLDNDQHEESFKA